MSQNPSAAAPAAHPVPPLRALLWPPRRPEAAALLASPGLEPCFNARGALLQAFTEIAAAGRRKVLLPAFHCPSAITPALMAGLEPVFYRIRTDLSIDTDDLLAKADRDVAAVLAIQFFGIPQPLHEVLRLQELGIRVVEDCSHSFLTSPPLALAGNAASDYRVYSFWKIIPSGVGGGLWRRPGIAAPAGTRAAAPLTSRARNYKLLLEEVAAHGDQPALAQALALIDRVQRLARPRRATAPASASAGTSSASPQGPTLERGEGHYPVHARLANGDMPAHVRRIFESSDLAAIAARRRENFSVYLRAAERLAPLQPLVRSLPVDACPWVFPVLLERRDERDFRLREAGVALHTFGIYLHSALFERADADTVADARFLAERVLCLAVHQNLTPDNIAASCNTIERGLAAPVSTCH